jgi:hypothetical protein
MIDSTEPTQQPTTDNKEVFKPFDIVIDEAMELFALKFAEIYLKSEN